MLSLGRDTNVESVYLYKKYFSARKNFVRIRAYIPEIFRLKREELLQIAR